MTRKRNNSPAKAPVNINGPYPGLVSKQVKFQENISTIVGQLGEVVVSAVTENAAAQIEIAKIQLPISQKNQELQATQIANQHEAQMNAQKALIERSAREFWFNAVGGGIIITFMISISGFLLYTGDKTNGMAVVGLLIGLVGGFLSGAGWEKTKSKTRSGTATGE